MTANIKSYVGLILLRITSCGFMMISHQDGKQSAIRKLRDNPKKLFELDTDGNPNFCQSRPLYSSTNDSCSFNTTRHFQTCHPSENQFSVTYVPADMTSTIVTDFDLVCDENYKVMCIMHYESYISLDFAKR